MKDFWGPFADQASSVSKVSQTDVYNMLDAALEPFLFTPKDDGIDPRKCPACGGRLVLKPSKMGAFIGCSNFSNERIACKYTQSIFQDDDDEGFISRSDDDEDHHGGENNGAGVLVNVRILGVDPSTGQPVFIKKGPYGLYLQLVSHCTVSIVNIRVSELKYGFEWYSIVGLLDRQCVGKQH